MKKKKVIITTAAILLVVILVVAAILLLKSDAFGMNSSQRKKPVAVVGGSEKITANELAIDFQNYYGNIDNYNMYALYYGVGTYHDVSTPEGVEELRQEILHELIEQRAYVCLAKEKGITLTAEEKAECAKAGAEAYDTMISQYAEQFAKNGYTDPKNYAVSQVAQYFADYGIGTKSEFVRRSTYTEEAEMLRTKVTDKLKEESGITAEQAAELYPDWVAGYKDGYTDGVISTYDEYFIQGYQKIRYPYIPEDFVFLRVIELNDQARAEALTAEIGTDAEVFEKYCGNKDNKVEENKDGLMPLVDADASYAIGANDSSFDPSVYEAVSAMNVGDIKLLSVTTEAEHEHAEGGEHSEDEEPAAPVTTYYIVRRVEGATGFAPFEKVKDLVSEDVIDEAQSKAADESVHAWLDAEGNAVIDEDVYAMVKGA